MKTPGTQWHAFLCIFAREGVIDVLGEGTRIIGLRTTMLQHACHCVPAHPRPRRVVVFPRRCSDLAPRIAATRGQGILVDSRVCPGFVSLSRCLLHITHVYANAYGMSNATQTAKRTSADRRPFGPYSRRLQRGAIGASLDGRSELGRFVRHLEAELVAHVGGAPSITQKLLIDRIIRTRLQLDALDEKLAAGSFAPHDQRTYGALLNAHRLGLRELGKPAKAQPQDALQYLANKRAGHAAA